MILVINTCSEELHYFEFVKPVEEVLRSIKVECKVRHYNELQKKDLIAAEKIIICGTSLKDFQYLKDLKKFSFLKSPDFEKPILGICAGMQLICLAFGSALEKSREIGLTDAFFGEPFFSIERKAQVYSLHNSAVKQSKALEKNFKVFARSEHCVQAVKHLQKPFYGVLFHPEVRNRQLIEEFAKD